MLKLFHASGIIMDKKSELKGKSEHFEGNLTRLGSKKEESYFKTKDEDFLQIKHEMDSDDDQNMGDQWEPKEASRITSMISEDEDDDYDDNYDEDYDEDMWDIEEEKPKPNKTGKKRQKRKIPESA